MCVSVKSRSLFLILPALLLAAACSASGMIVENPRMLPAAAGADAAVYFVLVNHSFSDDTILGASSDAAQSIEIHRSALIEADDLEAMQAGGSYNYSAPDGEEEEAKSELAEEEITMDMAVLSSAEIKSGYEMEFEPGYYHLMLKSLEQDLRVGDDVTVILHFEQAGDVSIDVQVVEKIE